MNILLIMLNDRQASVGALHGLEKHAQTVYNRYKKVGGDKWDQDKTVARFWKSNFHLLVPTGAFLQKKTNLFNQGSFFQIYRNEQRHVILLMAEILHQLIGSLSHYL